MDSKGSELDVFTVRAAHAAEDSMRVQRGRGRGRTSRPDRSVLWQAWSVLSSGQATRASVSQHIQRRGTLQSTLFLFTAISHSHLPNVSHRDPEPGSRVNHRQAPPDRFHPIQSTIARLQVPTDASTLDPKGFSDNSPPTCFRRVHSESVCFSSNRFFFFEACECARSWSMTFDAGSSELLRPGLRCQAAMSGSIRR